MLVPGDLRDVNSAVAHFRLWCCCCRQFGKGIEDNRVLPRQLRHRVGADITCTPGTIRKIKQALPKGPRYVPHHLGNKKGWECLRGHLRNTYHSIRFKQSPEGPQPCPASLCSVRPSIRALSFVRDTAQAESPVSILTVCLSKLFLPSSTRGSCNRALPQGLSGQMLCKSTLFHGTPRCCQEASVAALPAMLGRLPLLW